MEVVLASASPRRLALLEQVGIKARVCPADFEEEAGRAESAHDVALHNALGKCRAVASKLGDAVPVVAADTIVVIDEAILGKPKNALEAEAMLTSLSGRSHQVLTGVAVRYQGKELAPDKALTLCMNNYRSTGTGGYGCYLTCRKVKEQPTEIAEMIMDYIVSHGDIRVDRTKWLTVLH